MEIEDPAETPGRIFGVILYSRLRLNSFCQNVIQTTLQDLKGTKWARNYQLNLIKLLQQRLQSTNQDRTGKGEKTRQLLQGR